MTARELPELPVFADLIYTMAHCVSAAEEGVPYACSRDKLNALTTLGLMEKVARNSWAPTKAGEQVAALETFTKKAAPRVSEGMVLIPSELLDRFPELNLSNYNDDDVAALNAWGIEVVTHEAALGARGKDG